MATPMNTLNRDSKPEMKKCRNCDPKIDGIIWVDNVNNPHCVKCGRKLPTVFSDRLLEKICPNQRNQNQVTN